MRIHKQIKMEIIKEPEDWDSDTVRFTVNGARVGHGYKSKSDGKIGLIRCPKCGKENYALAVISGKCVWCGFDANNG